MYMYVDDLVAAYIPTYRIVGFSRYLISVNSWFSVFSRFYSHDGSAKSSAVQWVVCFFEDLNFMNEQHPWKSWNLCTSKKPTIRYWLFLKHFVNKHIMSATCITITLYMTILSYWWIYERPRFRWGETFV